MGQSSDMPLDEDRTVIGFPISTEAAARFHIRNIDMTARWVVGALGGIMLGLGLWRVRQGI